MIDIGELKSLPVEEAALRADCRLRQIEQEFKANFAELGALALESRTLQLWRHVTLDDFSKPKSFTEWLTDCLPVSSGTAFAALRVAEKLSFLTVDERGEISRSNLERLAKLSSGLVTNDLCLRRAARILTPAAFAEYVEREHPEQHLPSDCILRFRISSEQKVRVEQALKHVMETYTCGRDEAFGLIVEAYLMEMVDVAQAK